MNRPFIKYILENLAAMQSCLQIALFENEILKEKNKRVETPAIEKITYAQAAAMRMHEPRSLGAIDPRKRASPPKEKYEVVLIKPEKEDKGNDQIKEMLKKLERVRRTLKIRNFRQLRKQGVLIEVMDKTDVETIKVCDLKKEGFVVERPKKVNLSIIIYDVESDLKEDLLRKNSRDLFDTEVSDIINDIKFVLNFKVKDEMRINCVVQLPFNHYSNIMNKGRVFMM